MALAATFLSGAKGRLLPPSIPFRFFAAASLFYIAFWIGLFLSAGDLAAFAGGAGPVLGTVHLATLGVLAMTAIGAALQLLSVATRRPIRVPRASRVISWLFIPGVAILAWGMAWGAHHAMMTGAGLCILGLAIFFVQITDNLRSVKGMGVIVGHAWGMLACLAGLAALGVVLIADMEHGFLPDHGSIALVHFIVAVYGFMGLLVLGFSYILVPMFALSPAPPTAWGKGSLALSGAGLVLAAAGLLAALPLLVAAGLIAGLVGVSLYLRAMAWVFENRMRKRLGLSFVLVKIAWVLLPLSLLFGGLGLAGWWPESGPALFGLLTVGGWLLTFLLGILQRIVPFLSSMHASGGTGSTPLLPSAMGNERLLQINAIGHLGGLALVALGIGLNMTMIIKAGAALGLAGALAFGWFVAMVIWRMSRTLAHPAA
jgi:hypothetical protein